MKTRSTMNMLCAFVFVAAACDRRAPDDRADVVLRSVEPTKEVVDEMGPPPYEYIRIRGESVPGWMPLHLRRAPLGEGPLLWSPVGPRPIVDEFWSGDDDASGRVVSIAPHPTDPDACYIGSASGGVWKTTDGGLNWSPLTDELSNLNHGAVALDPSDPEVVYAGTGEYTVGSDGDGLFRSTDGGATWLRIATAGQTSFRFSGLIVDPTDPLVIHCAGSGGYDRSDDGGATWNQYLSGSVSSLGISPNNAQVLYLGDHNDGVRKSVNGGDSWSMLAGGLPTTSINRIVLAVSASAGPLDTVYAALLDGSDLEGLYRTVDSGATWTKLVNTPNFPSPQGWYDAFVGVDPTNPNIVYCGGVFPSYAVAGVIKTIDGGVTWADITVSPTSGQLHPDQHAIAFGPDGTVWVGNDGGVWKSTNGGSTWINTNATLAVTQNYAIALNPAMPEIMMTGTQDNGTIERQMAVDEWPQIRAGDGGYLAYDFDDPTRRYTTYVRLAVARQEPSSFTNITGPWLSDPREFISPLVMDPNDSRTLLGGTNRIWRTNNADTDADWFAISTDQVAAGGTIDAIAVAVGNSNLIYCGGGVGNVGVTTDASTWFDRSTGLPAGTISDIVIDPDDPDHAFIGFRNTSGARVLETMNQGVSWSSVTGDLPAGVSARALAVDWRPLTPWLYVGTGVGVYSSGDGGLSWIKDGADLPNVNIGDLLIDEERGMIYAGTYGRGAWKAALPLAVTNPDCPADCAGAEGPDGIVNVTDLLALLSAWGPVSGLQALCDIEPASARNGEIDVSDLLALLAGWGICPPTNDQLADAPSVGNGIHAFDTTAATTDGPPDCADLQADIWFCYTATCSGSVTASLCGSSFDTVIAVYQGCDPFGTLIACNDDQCGEASEVSFAASLGQSYLIRVGGPPGSRGTGSLTLSCLTNDLCSLAVPISEGNTAFSTIGATTDGPAHASCATGDDGGQTVNDIWFSWTAPSLGSLTISTCGQADYDTDLVIYSNTDCGNLLLLDCNDDYAGLPCGGEPTYHSQIDNVPVSGGRSILIRVGGWSGSAAGTGTLTLTFEPFGLKSGLPSPRPGD